MKAITAAIKKYSMLTYFALTLVISWGGIFLVMGYGGIMGTREISEELMPFVYLATLLGPAVSGILMIGVSNGREGYRSLVKRLLRWRVGARWYAVALLTAPLLITVTLFGLSVTSPAFYPAIISADDKLSMLLIGVVMGLAVGFFEELGWTGFALPRLRRRYGILASGLVLGLFWGLWHLPLFLGSTQSSGAIPPILYLVVLLFSFLPVYRVLMVWVYDHTGSLLTMMLMHAPLSASQLILIPASMTGSQSVAYDLVFALLLWICVAVVVFINGGRLESENAALAR